MPFVNFPFEDSEPESNEFIIEIDTGVSTTFHISKGMMTTNDQAQYIVDKGDGNQVTIDGLSDSNFDLTYAAAGVYTIKIKPNAPTAEYLINYYDDDVDCEKLVKIQQFGFAKLKTLWGCENLTDINDIATLVDSTDVNSILRECKALVHIKNLELWTDWSQVVSAANAFEQLHSYNEAILIDDLSSLSNGSAMCTQMYAYNHKFLFDDLSSLQNGQGMFRNMSAYEYEMEFITSSVLTNLNWFLTESGLIPKLTLSECSRVTTANDMLFGCEYISDLELHGFAVDLDTTTCYLVTESVYLTLIDSLADLTALPSKTLTHGSTGWTSNCATALSNKNWDD